MEAVIFCGIQASGKTTFYRDRFFDTHVRISMDLLRTRRREQLLLGACIEGKQQFVVDNTNATVAAAEVGIGLAIVILIFRNRETINVDEINLLRW